MPQKNRLKVRVPQAVKALSHRLEGRGVQLYVVGGAVRDAIMGIKSKDIDLLMVGVSYQEAVDMLRDMDIPVREDVVSEAPVVHAGVGGEWLDLAIARKEYPKLPDGVPSQHNIKFETGKSVTLEEDLFRRDLTCNSIAWRVSRGELVDPYGGVQHIIARKMVPTNVNAFGESFDRPLRAGQHAARFGFNVSDRLANVASSVPVNLAPKEQWWKQMQKLLLSPDPAKGIRALGAMRIVKHLPYLDDLKDVEQDEEWHPEGNVLIHTLLVLKAAAHLTEDEPDDVKIAVRLAALCHDMGKLTTTVVGEDGRARSPDHAKVGVPMALEFMQAIGMDSPKMQQRVCVLVEQHMRHPTTDRGIRRLAVAMQPSNIREWSLLCMADQMGRMLEEEFEEQLCGEIADVVRRSEELSVVDTAPPNLVMGRHLIARGMEAGKHFGPILEAAFEAQLDGEFDTTESGLLWLQVHGYLGD